MTKRGGGIKSIDLVDKTNDLENYYQLHCCFETLDAMGANFINSSLEQFAKTFKTAAKDFDLFTSEEKDVEIVMSILSNYVPNCVVRAEVSCPVSDLNEDELIIIKECLLSTDISWNVTEKIIENIKSNFHNNMSWEDNLTKIFTFKLEKPDAQY